MVERSAHDVSQLLSSWSRGDEQALEKLVPLVYGELHRMARRYLASERTGHTLQTTALINEVYLRLADSPQIGWQNRAHFFAISAQGMRRILVDHARARGADKRGGPLGRVSLDEAVVGSFSRPDDFLVLDEAMKRLAWA